MLNEQIGYVRTYSGVIKWRATRVLEELRTFDAVQGSRQDLSAKDAGKYARDGSMGSTLFGSITGMAHMGEPFRVVTITADCGLH